MRNQTGPILSPPTPIHRPRSDRTTRSPRRRDERWIKVNQEGGGGEEEAEESFACLPLLRFAFRPAAPPLVGGLIFFLKGRQVTRERERDALLIDELTIAQQRRGRRNIPNGGAHGESARLRIRSRWSNVFKATLLLGGQLRKQHWHAGASTASPCGIIGAVAPDVQ
jgi:hypothetical protein